MTENCCHWWWL